jgi:hypothetical protein
MTHAVSTFSRIDDWVQSFAFYMIMPFSLTVLFCVTVLLPIGFVRTRFWPKPGPVPNNVPYELPIRSTLKKGAMKKLAWPFFWIMNGIGLTADILIYANSEIPQLQSLINPGASLAGAAVWELILLYMISLAKGYSASLTVDQTGIKSEHWEESRTWTWKSIADVKVQTVYHVRAPAEDKLFILPKGAQADGWIDIDTMGQNPWRMSVTIKKGIDRWGKA